MKAATSGFFLKTDPDPVSLTAEIWTSLIFMLGKALPAQSVIKLSRDGAAFF